MRKIDDIVFEVIEAGRYYYWDPDIRALSTVFLCPKYTLKKMANRDECVKEVV